jgi:hypothetical protein
MSWARLIVIFLFVGMLAGCRSFISLLNLILIVGGPYSSLEAGGSPEGLSLRMRNRGEVKF